MELTRVYRPWACLVLLGVAACDCAPRVASIPPRIAVTPAKLDFGSVAIGTVAELPLDVTSVGRVPLTVSSVTAKQTNDISVASVLVEDCNDLPRQTSSPLVLSPEACARVIVRFKASAVESISNLITIQSNDPSQPKIEIPVVAAGVIVPTPMIKVCVLDSSGNQVDSDCTNLYASPPFVPTLDFGMLNHGQSAVRVLRIIDTGNSPLSVSALQAQSSPAGLSIMDPPMLPATIGVMKSADVQVALTASGSGALTGKVAIHSNASGRPEVDIPVIAMLPAPACTAPTARVTATVGSSAIPSSGVLQNTTVTLHGAGSGGSTAAASYTWSLVSAPSGNTSQVVPNGATASLDCSQPGTYVVGLVVKDTDGCSSQQATISLQVNALPPTCGPSTQFIYTIDEYGEMYKFVPSTASFTSLGTINCPSISTANTMAVDRSGIAWVEYEDGTLFRVDTSTLRCYSTSFSPSQTSSAGWGSAFVLDTSGGSTATYYIAEGGELATINTTTLAVSKVGTFSSAAAQEPELSGTPSAKLFGFFPDSSWTLAEIDRNSGNLLSQRSLNVISNYVSSAGNWAFASWGNDFWFFVGDGSTTDVFEYNGATQTTSHVTSTNTPIVGAGVSPCVP